jgi:hypothetical protein
LPGLPGEKTIKKGECLTMKKVFIKDLEDDRVIWVIKIYKSKKYAINKYQYINSLLSYKLVYDRFKQLPKDAIQKLTNVINIDAILASSEIIKLTDKTDLFYDDKINRYRYEANNLITSHTFTYYKNENEQLLIDDIKYDKVFIYTHKTDFDLDFSKDIEKEDLDLEDLDLDLNLDFANL